MRLGLADLIDPRLRALAERSRAFYENRTAGRGPNGVAELREYRAAAPAPAPSSPVRRWRRSSANPTSCCTTTWPWPARLSGSDVDVDLRIYPEAPHGFTGHPTSLAQAALDDIDAWLDGRVGARPCGIGA
ncbi:hypothetical protein ACFVMC_26485 [Nocardia sp. NPDC127579]|uniref:hypothetical protein n=1 Tax=Nocardia sp. NPDC127579 TaxID=3345402 RepID=UPI00362B1770